MSSKTTDNQQTSQRRTFLKLGGSAAAGLMAGTALGPNAAAHPAPENPAFSPAMPMRNLGRTGYKVGIFSLGGQAALEHGNNFDNAVPIIDRALDLGVNYIDTSSIYGGRSAGASSTSDR